MDDLLKSAFVGTASVAPPTPGGHLVEAALPDTSGDIEHSVLLRAGARAVWERAGYQPRREVLAPEPSPVDERNEVSERGAVILRLVFSGEARELLPEFLEQVDEAELRLPAALLPDALSAVGRSHELRRLIRKVIGERGRWLARLNPDWAWAGNEQAEVADRDSLERLWGEGSTSERVEALKTLRESHAAEARNRLEGTFGNEKADVRARLLETLAIGLSLDDEPFLEKSLGDRSESVRAVAADLLARLPASALVQRMTARADAMLLATRGGMLKRTLKIECTPPQEIEKEWLRDGVPKIAPHAGFGPRATWTEAVIGAVPLSHWTTRFEGTPNVLIAAAKEDEFGDSIIAGWTRSAVRSGSEADWLNVLVTFWLESLVASAGKSRKQADAFKQYFYQQQLQSAVAGLDREAAETFVASHLRQNDTVGEIAFSLLDRIPRPWSKEFTRAWLGGAVSILNGKVQRADYRWVQSLGIAASAAPLACLDEMIGELEPIGTDPEHQFSGATRRLLDTIRLRRDFHREVSAQRA